MRTVFGLVLINAVIAAVIASVLWLFGVTGSLKATALTGFQMAVYSCLVGIPAALLLPRLGPWISTRRFPVNALLILLCPLAFAIFGSFSGGVLLVILGAQDRARFTSTFLQVGGISGLMVVSIAVVIFTREFRRAGIRLWTRK